MATPKYHIELVEPARLTARDLAACVNLMKGGEAVDVESARRQLPRATAIATASLGGEIIGVGAIKKQRLGYAAGISEKSGFSFSAETLELGYVAVGPSHQGRGLSHKIVAALLADRDVELFATTSSGPMKNTLSRAGFVCQGKEWDGNSSRLSLWLRQRS